MSSKASTMSTLKNPLDDYSTDVCWISAPFTDVGKSMRHSRNTSELPNWKCLIDKRVHKTLPFGVHRPLKLMKLSSGLDTDSSSTDSIDDTYQCTICSSKFLCLCRECITNKIRFADKRNMERKFEYKKRCLIREIEEILVFHISVNEAISSTRESIESLKHSIINRKKAIKRKRNAINIICSKTERYRKTVQELKERCRGHEKVFCEPPNSLQTFVNAYEDKLQEIVNFNAEWFLKIFPIQWVLKPEPDTDDVERCCQEMIAEACKEEPAPLTEKMIPVECGTSSEHCYSICGCKAPDRAEYKILKGWLSIGIPTLPVARPVYDMFAAFVYAIQLVNMLTVNFDVCIPEQISFQDFSLCRKWTEGLFDTDIFKLNRAVVMLCLSLGIESKAVEPLNPFANLLLISNIMDDSSPVAKLTHYPLTNELAVILEDDLKQICWAERERTEEDEWYMVRYRDNYYDETFDSSTPLRPITSLSDLEEMLRDFSAFPLPTNRMSEHDFQCILEDASRQHSPAFLPRILNFFRNFGSK